MLNVVDANCWSYLLVPDIDERLRIGEMSACEDEMRPSTGNMGVERAELLILLN